MLEREIKLRSGSMTFVEAANQLFYLRIPDNVKHVQVGREVICWQADSGVRLEQ